MTRVPMPCERGVATTLPASKAVVKHRMATIPVIPSPKCRLTATQEQAVRAYLETGSSELAAELLGIPEGTLRSRLHAARARQQLPTTAHLVYWLDRVTGDPNGPPGSLRGGRLGLSGATCALSGTPRPRRSMR